MKAPDIPVHATTDIDVAKVIQAAAANPLGIFALVAIILGVLAAIYFRQAPIRYRTFIFLILFVGVAALGRAIFVAMNVAPDPKGPENITRANAALAQGQLTLASNYFIQVQRANPNNWEAAFGLGTVAYRQSDFVGALKQYQEALKLHPNDTSILNNLAMSHEALSDYAEALRKYSEAIQSTDQASQFRTDLLYDEGRMNVLLWLRSGQAASTELSERASSDFDQFVKRHGSPVHFATYHLACLATTKDQAASVRFLDQSVSELSRYSGENLARHKIIMQHLLTTDRAEPDEAGDPIGCPPLIRSLPTARKATLLKQLQLPK